VTSERFQKALKGLISSIESNKPEQGDLLNIVNIGLAEGLSRSFIIQAVGDAYDECRISSSEKKLGDVNLLEYLAIITRGRLPHEKQLAHTTFSETVKRFHKCTENEREQAMRLIDTKTIEKFTEFLRRTIAAETGYLPGGN
jgi:hypothetical protein